MIDFEELVRQHVDFSFSRSGGSGGQNVNKVNTKVTARLSLDTLTELTEAQRDRLREKLGNRINADDELVLQVQDEREQLRNREIAVTRLANLLRHGLKRAKPRRPTKPSRGARERRLREKRRRADIKRHRRHPDRE